MTTESPEDVPLGATDPTPPSESAPQAGWNELAEAMRTVHARDPYLADSLAAIFSVVAAEAGRSPRFANALSRAFRPRKPSTESLKAPGGKRGAHRRKPGPFDPFEVFSEGGAELLFARLSVLGIDELRDIVAEHGMDTDRLAMKWKDPQRVVGRIIERVEDRSTKGSAFR